MRRPFVSALWIVLGLSACAGPRSNGRVWASGPLEKTGFRVYGPADPPPRALRRWSDPALEGPLRPLLVPAEPERYPIDLEPDPPGADAPEETLPVGPPIPGAAPSLPPIDDDLRVLTPVQNYLRAHPELPQVLADALRGGRLALGLSEEAVRALFGREPDQVFGLQEEEGVRTTWLFEGGVFAGGPTVRRVSFLEGEVVGWGE